MHRLCGAVIQTDKKNRSPLTNRTDTLWSGRFFLFWRTDASKYDRLCGLTVGLFNGNEQANHDTGTNFKRNKCREGVVVFQNIYEEKSVMPKYGT